MYAAANIIDFVRGFGQRAKAAKVKNELRNYMTDPEATITAVNDIDPVTGMSLKAQYQGEQAAAAAAQQATQKRKLDAFGQVTGFLRQARDAGQTDLGAAIDGMAPFLKTNLGADDNQLAEWKQVIAGNPGILDALDEEGLKAKAKLAGTTDVVGPGAALSVGGKITHQQPFAPKVMAVPNGSGGRDVITVDPNAPPQGGGTAPGPGGVSLTVDTVRPFIKAQESSGDYGALNKETGALGAYQVMPATGAALAKQLGLPWRPDMMRGTSQSAIRYQDAIGGAAIKEAIDASGGDPVVMAKYYHGGSNREGWGPKTEQYATELTQRLGGGAPAANAAPVQKVYSTQGANKQVRNATPAELAAVPGAVFAQVDPTGKLVNIKMAPKVGGAAGAKPGPNPEGQGKLTETLGSLAASYSRLADLGGIVDPRKSTASNLWASAASSTVGQMLSGMTGSEAQSVRTQINNIRPLLINDIRAATGMSSKGLDSNAELKFYLQAATDPQRDLMSNLAAIQVLDNKFGTGTALQESLPPELFKRVAQRAGVMMKSKPINVPPPPGTRAVNPKTGAAVVWRNGKWVPEK